MKNKYLYLINQILYSLFSFSTLFFSARLMSIEDYGQFSYAYSFIPLISIGPLALVYLPMMNFFSKWKKKNNIYINVNSFFNLILTVILSICLWIILYFSDTLSDQINLFILFYFIYQAYEFIRRVFIVKQEVNRLNKFELFKLLLFLIGIKLINDYYKLNIDNLIILLLVIFVIMISFNFSKLKVYPINKNSLLETSKESFSFGKWLLLSNFVQNISSNLFIYLSGIILTAESIARLNAPKIFLGITTVFLLSMDNYYTPKLAAKRWSFETNFKKEISLIFKELKFFYILFFIAGLIIIFFQDYFIECLFGQKYTSGDNFLWAYIVVGLIYSLMRPFIILFRVFENTKFLFKSSLFSFFLVVITTYPVMNIFGAIGGIGIMILGTLLQLIIFLNYLHTYDKRIY